MKKTIEQLKDQESKLRVKIFNIENEEIHKRVLPEANKLLGKCYKYLNSYGGGSETKPWWLYRKIVKIDFIIDKNKVCVFVDEFQKITDGEINFKKKNIGYRDLRGDNYQEITPKEYETEKKKLIEVLKAF